MTVQLTYNGNLAGTYKYKFQGQEHQDELGLNWDSFKWRNYDVAIGRFMSIDPLSEQYAYQSHYNFSENRVIDWRELEGLEGTPTQQWNGAFKKMGQTFAGAIDRTFAKIEAFFTVSTEVAPVTSIEKTTTASANTNFLDYVNFQSQGVDSNPFTIKVETKTELKVTVEAKGKIGVLDAKVENSTSKGKNGTDTNETKVVVGKGNNGVFVSSNTNLKTKETTVRGGVQVEAETPKVNKTSVKVGASFSVGQKE